MPSRTRPRLTRTIIIAASAAGALLLLAGPAQAHVGVIGDVIPGEPATLQFRVPSELADATTVRVAVSVPPELAVTSVPDHDGWSHETIEQPPGKGTQVMWTAEPGHDIRPGESDSFPVKVGPVPDQYSATFTVEQLYSNGTIAAWDQEQTGGEKPEFPAPVLLINPEAEPPTDVGKSGLGSEGEAADADSARTGSDVETGVNAADVSAETEQSSATAGMLMGTGAAVVLGIAVAAVMVRRRQDNNRTENLEQASPER